MMNIYYTVFKIKPGWMALAGSDSGLKRVTLPASCAEAAQATLNFKDIIRDDSRFTDLVAQIRTYFDGKKVEFDFQTDLPDATDFQKAVWQLTRFIPYGETRSYLWIAESAGFPGAARAVGNCMARNPLPLVVPCHRVIKSNGSLGGFRGGLPMKKYLLNIEKTAMYS
ncbi:MAG: methylated-DNA--[protein]-cysteine S-methyltransferase, partial [Chloroflexi bacterium]|nr:methylated-DNA--[protein]-cysteine S-methyltransferase [Chloroflexota bacterium]